MILNGAFIIYLLKISLFIRVIVLGMWFRSVSGILGSIGMTVIISNGLCLFLVMSVRILYGLVACSFSLAIIIGISLNLISCLLG